MLRSVTKLIVFRNLNLSHQLSFQGTFVEFFANTSSLRELIQVSFTLEFSNCGEKRSLDLIITYWKR